jgi:transcriptional regulator with XRE-family HTH domain
MLQQGRLLHGLGQRQLAEQLGLGQKYVWEMEQGKPGLLTDRLFAMLRATGVRLYVESGDRRAGRSRDHRIELCPRWVSCGVEPRQGRPPSELLRRVAPRGAILSNLASRVGVQEYDTLGLAAENGLFTQDALGLLRILGADCAGVAAARVTGRGLATFRTERQEKLLMFPVDRAAVPCGPLRRPLCDLFVNRSPGFVTRREHAVSRLMEPFRRQWSPSRSLFFRYGSHMAMSLRFLAELERNARRNVVIAALDFVRTHDAELLKRLEDA